MTALREFAAAKLLPPEFLTRHGLSDDAPGIRIEYGPNARGRVREKAETAHPTLWVTGDNRPMRVFGYQLVERFACSKNKGLLIVEGESDALTAWYNRRPALGIPGATMAKVIRGEDVGFAELCLIVREPGDAGKKFVELVAKRLHEVGFAGGVLEITLSPHKDISEVHVANDGDADKFATALNVAINKATPVEPSAAPKASLGVLSDDDLMAQVAEHVEWLAEGLLRESGIMLLSARPKVGKSELGRNFAKAVATGGEFLGRRCRKGNVMWVGLEEPVAHLQERIEIMGLRGLGIKWVVQQPAGDEAKWLRAVVERHRPDLVIIDTIARLLRIEDINHYSEVLRATQIMLDLRSEFGTAFCAIHHNNRADSTLGSIQWEAFCDCVMLLTRSPEGERFVRTIQRSGTDMESTRLDRDEDTGRITVAESKSLADQRAAEQRILDYAASIHPRRETREHLAQHCGRPVTIGRAAVDGLTTGGLLIPSGSGHRKDPRVYGLSSYSTNGRYPESISSTTSTAIQLVEESDETRPPIPGHFEETPRHSEESEESQHSGKSDLTAYIHTD